MNARLNPAGPMALGAVVDSVAGRTKPPHRVFLRAESELAGSSPDHLQPWGTRHDNSVNPRFNDKIYKLYPKAHTPLKVLDLGCSGGGFVKSCFDEGCLAVGLEGSDFSKKLGRAEWRTIPEYLFTCDITQNFELWMESGGQVERMVFDVITSWEVMEHIAEQDLGKVAANVKKHLAPNGLWIMSISPREEIIHGTRLHQTVQPKPWWVNAFARLGLIQLESLVRYFNTQFVRGPKYKSPGSFHLVLSSDPAQAPSVPKESWLRRLHDRWLGSLPQRVISGTYI